MNTNHSNKTKFCFEGIFKKNLNFLLPIYFSALMSSSYLKVIKLWNPRGSKWFGLRFKEAEMKTLHIGQTLGFMTMKKVINTVIFCLNDH